MSAHLGFVHQHVAAGAIRASGEAIRLAVVVTDDELVTGRAGLFGRWGGKIERFALARLSSLRVVPNPSAYLLQLEFTGVPPASVTLMYEPLARRDFDEIVRMLQQRLERSGAGGER